MMDRQTAIKRLRDEPYKIGHMLGFTKLTPLHNEWIKAMCRKGSDDTLQAHRGSFKTTCVAIALVILMICRPNERILFMRKTDDDVKEVIKQVQKILMDPKIIYFVQCIYGITLKLTKATANEITTNLSQDFKGTAQLTGLGIGSSLTGKHFDRIFTDDIVNINDRISKAERDRTRLVYQELQNIKNRGGRIFNTGTPWHKDDCFALMPNAVKYDCYSTGLISAEELEEIRSNMLPSLFAANYELKHIASEDVIFTAPNTGADPSQVENGIGHIDAAYGGSDYTAFTICKKHDNKYYIYGRLWHRHIDDVTDEIIKLRSAFLCGKIYCEDNGDKGYLAKDLRAKGERVGLYHEKMNKNLKITSYLKAAWNSVYFIEGTDADYINQICDYNEHAEHDDAPDSAASVIRLLWSKKDSNDYTPLWNNEVKF